jgi:hypothetical protein
MFIMALLPQPPCRVALLKHEARQRCAAEPRHAAGGSRMRASVKSVDIGFTSVDRPLMGAGIEAAYVSSGSQVGAVAAPPNVADQS